MPTAVGESFVKVSMVVFTIDSFIDNIGSLSAKCLSDALTQTGFGQFSSEIQDQKALCPKNFLQNLAVETSFPRTKIELVLRKFNDLILEKIKSSSCVLGMSGAGKELGAIVKALKAQGLTISCASYQYFNVAIALLLKFGLADCFDIILGADSVVRPPPSPEIAYKLCLSEGLSPKEVVFVDSLDPGVAAAEACGCHTITSTQRSLASIEAFIKAKNEQQFLNPIVTKWQQSLTVIFHLDQYPEPFLESGYGYPASLVDIHGSSMCQLVLKNLNLQSPDVIFIVRKSKYDRYNMKFFLQSIGKSNSQVITYESDDSDPKEFKMNKTLLLAKPFLANNDKPVLVLNCSQIIEWDSNSFLYAMANPCVTGGILTFNSAHPRYGFLETDADGWVSKCALNTPISKHATAGVFYWKSGNDFIKYTEAAVAKGLDGCNKLACLYAYQKAIEDGCKIRRYDCRRVWEISSSQDLDCYLKLGV